MDHHRHRSVRHTCGGLVADHRSPIRLTSLGTHDSWLRAKIRRAFRSASRTSVFPPTSFSLKIRSSIPSSTSSSTRIWSSAWDGLLLTSGSLLSLGTLFASGLGAASRPFDWAAGRSTVLVLFLGLLPFVDVLGL